MLYTEIKQRLYNDLIVPFSALELEKSERKEIIKKIFMGISSEELDVYIKFRKLSDYAGLIKKIFNYYHNEDLQKSSFPEIDFGKNFNYSGNLHLSPRTKGYVEKHSSYHQIQFLIKECFFDYFNPFNKMKLCDPENTVNIEKMTKTVDLKSPAIGNFPTDIEINKRIISFLNYRTNQSWRKTCKSAFFQSAYQPLFFYALGAPVVVAEENNSFNSAQDEYNNLITPKENIQESDLCDSFSSCKNSDDMLLFTSLYQAIEYAQSKKGFGVRSNDIRTIAIPGVFLVVYQGSFSTLKFTDTFIALGTEVMSENYVKYSWVQFTKVNKKSLTPIKGIVVFNADNFASYYNDKVVDWKEDTIDCKMAPT